MDATNVVQINTGAIIAIGGFVLTVLGAYTGVVIKFTKSNLSVKAAHKRLDKIAEAQGVCKMGDELKKRVDKLEDEGQRRSERLATIENAIENIGKKVDEVSGDTKANTALLNQVITLVKKS